jgi:hypothetical protein
VISKTAGDRVSNPVWVLMVTESRPRTHSLTARKVATRQAEPDQGATSHAKPTSHRISSKLFTCVVFSIVTALLTALMAATACACLATPSIRANFCGASGAPAFLQNPALPSFLRRGPFKSWNVSLNWPLFHTPLPSANTHSSAKSSTTGAPVMQTPSQSTAGAAQSTAGAAQSTAGGTKEAVSGSPRTGFFRNVSQLIEENPSRLHYGVAAVDFDDDGQEELFVCGFGGAENQLLKVSLCGNCQIGPTQSASSPGQWN